VGTTVLVTGGAAPIGRCILDALADQGEPVVGFSGAGHQLGQPAHGVVGQLFDLPRLLHIIGERGVDRVVHATNLADPQLAIEMPVATVVSTVEGVLHLLEAARLSHLDGRIVVLSSASVYGNNVGPIDESTELRPRGPHAVASITGEHLSGIYSDLYGLDVIVLRLGDVYGPELAPPPIIGSIMAAAVSGDCFRSATGADHTFHLTHGEDVARAVAAALSAPRPSQRVYNITGGEGHSLGQIAALVRELFPESRVEIGPGGLPELDCQGTLEIRAADRELGYRPLWGLARGLNDYAEWLLAQQEAA
jgi:UDP-glucose 4-epimerase